MTDWRFSDPQWIHLIWGVLAITGLLLWLDYRGNRGLERFLATVMHDRLVHRPTSVRRTWWTILLTAAAMMLIAALMRPQSGFHEINTPRVGARLMVCLDVSRSMLAEDVAPNRLQRAKVELLDLLSYIDKDHVGLIAFAGKATVLCPLTSDFGFLRTVIQSAGPQSVPRGGTDLESPIRKAIAGFRGRTDLSRAIILITDGDHHDSFVIDAAKEASEQGIRIICIGFGDEAGSQIVITDPKTGAKTTLMDGEGKPVITRLAGKVLRDIALVTDGVYIPAGTGVLNLEEIYDAHISPLTRGTLDDHHRVVQQERYQWPLLGSIFFLISALFVMRPRSRPKRNGPGGAMITASLLLAPLPTARATIDQTPVPKTVVSEVDSSGIEPSAPIPNSRDAYNQGVKSLNSDKFDEAESAFSLANRHASTDAMVRLQSTYNLGWVEVRRADEKLDSNPQEALKHLHAAEGWFRDASQLDPEATRPRENLEIVARRAIALADALRQEDNDTIEVKLDGLVAAQRQMAGALREASGESESHPLEAQNETVRRACQALEVNQRAVLSLIDEVTKHIRGRIESINDIEDKNRTPEQSLRNSQLIAAADILFKASQRVGQTRRDLRGRQIKRAYRRSEMALGELKRSRDQLRNVVEIIGAVVTDAIELTQHVAMTSETGNLSVDPTADRFTPPTWLTNHYLADSLQTIYQRTEDISTRIGSNIAGIQSDSGNRNKETPADHDPNTNLIQTLETALPVVESASKFFAAAEESILNNQNRNSYTATAQGTKKIIEAHELFLDIRGIIETIYRDEQQIQNTVTADTMESIDDIREAAPMLAHWQQENISRGKRLDTMLQRELSALATDEKKTPTPDNNIDGEQSNDAHRKQQLEAAGTLLASTMQTFEGVKQVIEKFESETASPNDITSLHDGATLSVGQVEALRKLFFSIVEHLRETLRREISLADDTRHIMATHEDDTHSSHIAAIGSQQRALIDTTRQISTSLKTQSEQPSPMQSPNPNTPQGTTNDPAAAAAEQAARLGQAADVVLLAAEAMTTAADALIASPLAEDSIQNSQQQAVERLAEALQLLTPPSDSQQNKPGSDDRDQQQSPQHADSDNQEQENNGDPGSMSRLLQAVRDRDAQRQQKRHQHMAGYMPVEKDW